MAYTPPPPPLFLPMSSLSFLGKNGRARLTPVSRAQSRCPLIDFDASSDDDAPEEDGGGLDFDL